VVSFDRRDGSLIGLRIDLSKVVAAPTGRSRSSRFMMFAETTVLVVGAGPTGLLLASELLRGNVACHVIDAHQAPLPWDRATVVHPRTLELFEGLGLVGPLLTTGVKQRIARIHSRGTVLGEIDLSTCGSRYGFNIGISEEVTESILTDYLHTQGGKVKRSSTLTGLTDREGGLLATIQPKTRWSKSWPSGWWGATDFIARAGPWPGLI
jgi:2-polyprenyl-6-methoxyphenol hydroxylase-like FAD-dependent oxidoreductase